MIELIKTPAADILGLRIDGKIREDDITEMKEALEAQLLHYPKVNIYVELKNFNGITLKALWQHIKKMLPRATKINKKAVITDTNWVHSVGAASSKLAPLFDLQVKTFTFADKAAAMKWVAVKPTSQPAENNTKKTVKRTAKAN